MISRYLKIFEALAFEVKLELLSKMTESIKRGYKQPKKDKTQLLEELCGAWSDVNDDELISTIYNARTISDRAINLD